MERIREKTGKKCAAGTSGRRRKNVLPKDEGNYHMEDKVTDMRRSGRRGDSTVDKLLSLGERKKRKDYHK